MPAERRSPETKCGSVFILHLFYMVDALSEREVNWHSLVVASALRPQVCCMLAAPSETGRHLLVLITAAWRAWNGRNVHLGYFDYGRGLDPAQVSQAPVKRLVFL